MAGYNGSSPAVDESEICKAALPLAPLDWGLTFAWAFKGKLFGLALIPFTIQVIVGYFEYSRPLLREQLLLAKTIVRLAEAWLITVIFMLEIDFLRNESRSIFDLACGAFVHLPKVFISYIVTFIIVSMGFIAFALPGMVFLIFLIWAPGFCIAEFYTRKKSDRKENEAENKEDEIFSADDEAFQVGKLFDFSKSQLWDLGLVRSSRISGLNFYTSMQLMFMVVMLLTIPRGLVSLLSGGNVGFFWLVCSSALSTLAELFVIGAWAGAFTRLLPREAKEELAIGKYLATGPTGVEEREFRPGKKTRVICYEGRVLLQVFLGVIAFISAGYIAGQTLEQTRIPTKVSTEVTKTKITGKTLTVTLLLDDNETQFRWLDPQRFYIMFPSDKKKEDEKPEITSRKVLGEDQRLALWDILGGEAPLRDLISPKRAQLYDDNDNLLSAQNFSPYYQSLKVILTYQLPGSVAKNALRKAYLLYYLSMAGASDLVYQGQIGTNW